MMASSSRPTRILPPSSRDTSQLSAAKEVSHTRCRVVEIYEIDWSANQLRSLADCREVDGWRQPADSQIDVGPRSQSTLNGRPEDENLSGPESAQQGGHICKDIRIKEERRHQ